MDVGTLIAKGNRKIDYTIDNQQWFDYFNDCLMELTPILRLETKKTVPLEQGTLTYSTPSDLVEHDIIMIRLKKAGITLRRLPLDNFTDTGYKIYDGTIELQLGGLSLNTGESMDIFYYRKPAQIKTANQIPDIPEQYRPILIFYGAAKYNQTDEEPENESSFWKDYLFLRAQLEEYTRKRAASTRTLRWKVRRGING